MWTVKLNISSEVMFRHNPTLTSFEGYRIFTFQQLGVGAQFNALPNSLGVSEVVFTSNYFTFTQVQENTQTKHAAK